MLLSEIVMSISWKDVQKEILALYPDVQEKMADFLSTFIILKHTEPKLTPTMQIVVEEKHWPDIDEEPFVAVDGRFLGTEWTFSYPPVTVYDFSENADHANPLFDLEFFRWEEWLGMVVDAKSCAQFDFPQIVAHCLIEMTFIGFSQEAIQEEAGKILQRAEAYQSLSEEERALLAAASEEAIAALLKRDEEK